jgi:replicative DNA helicase
MNPPAIPVLAADSSDQDVFRSPPHNIEAERALIGAIMLNNRAYESVSDYLRAEHFSDAVHAKVFESASRLMEQGHQATPITLKTYLEQDPIVQEAGGMAYLTSLANSVVTIINAGDYGRLIYDLFLRRELINVGQDMVNEAFDSDLDQTALNQIEDSEQKLFDLSSKGQTEGGFEQFEHALTNAIDIAEAAHRRDGALAGTTTGLKDLDYKLGGLHPSDLLILAGRPAMGKTALATTIAFNAAQHFQNTDREEDRGKLVAFLQNARD